MEENVHAPSSPSDIMYVSSRRSDREGVFRLHHPDLREDYRPEPSIELLRSPELPFAEDSPEDSAARYGGPHHDHHGQWVAGLGLGRAGLFLRNLSTGTGRGRVD